MAAILVFLSKNGHRKEIEIKPGISIIGRRPDCDIRIPQSVVSRNHCRVVQKAEKTLIQDLGSTNGTFLNRERITDSVPVGAGDVISVGTVSFMVQIDGIPKEIVFPKTLVKKKTAIPDDSIAKNLSGISKTQISESPSDAVTLGDDAPLTEDDLLDGII